MILPIPDPGRDAEEKLRARPTTLNGKQRKPQILLPSLSLFLSLFLSLCLCLSLSVCARPTTLNGKQQKPHSVSVSVSVCATNNTQLPRVKTTDSSVIPVSPSLSICRYLCLSLSARVRPTTLSAKSRNHRCLTICL